MLKKNYKYYLTIKKILFNKKPNVHMHSNISHINFSVYILDQQRAVYEKAKISIGNENEQSIVIR